MDRCLIVFDLDTKALEENYHNSSWRNAYADIQRILQRLYPGFMLLQQSQPCPDYIACGAIASALHLGINETGEVLPEGYGCVSHGCCS